MTSDNDPTTLYECHPWILEMRPAIESIASTDSSILIRGESSRKRELVARAIHAASARRDSAFITVHSAAAPAELLEMELFGYEGRPSTGASRRKVGLCEFATGGTLYLEEIAGLSLDLQAKVHRVVQDRRFSSVGGSMPISANFRLIAGTDRDIAGAVARGEFMGELYNLIKVTEIAAPPLTRAERDQAKAEDEERARLQRAARESIDAHNDACRTFARKGLACPHCERRSREDIEFVDYAGQPRKSFFVCRACGRSFGHEL
jgi:two-component system NtrC family response regulator/two-component system response regulator PilR (NtrC family)